MDEPEENSLDGEGKPTSMTGSYEELWSLGDNYPQGQVEVLNIYGNTGKESDERVTNLSSQSLAYLLKGYVKSYQEKKITGLNGQHSKLHETTLVDKPLNAFLWGKWVDKNIKKSSRGCLLDFFNTMIGLAEKISKRTNPISSDISCKEC